MVIKKLFLIFMASIFFMTGCAPAKFIPREMPELKFEKTLPYNVDLSSIIKPEKAVQIWMDENFKEAPKHKAKYLVLTNKEYAKYIAQLRIKKTFKSIIKEQEVLINTYIDTINALKELVELERLKSEEYRNLWADSENAYRQEKYYNEMNNLLQKGLLGVISIGAIIALIIAL